MLRDLFRFF